MNTSFPLIPLGEVAKLRKEFIYIDDFRTYKRCRVQLHAQGIALRDVVAGEDIKTKRQQVCRAGELLVAEIDAKVGGFGIVPRELDGAIVSSHYFLFELSSSALDQRFLNYFVRTPAFQHQVTAQGSTNYAAIRPDDVLGYSIPLPSLDEQRRIVARIEELAAKIEEAQRLRASLLQDTDLLLLAEYYRIIEHAAWRSLKEVAPLQRRQVRVMPEGIYPELGVRSFGKGTFHKPSLTGIEVGSKRLFRINPGDLVFNNVFAWEGAVAVACAEDAGRVGSHRFLTCVPEPEIAQAEFLKYHFLTEQGLSSLGDASPGGAGRNRTLGIAALQAIHVPVPSVDAQSGFVSLLNQAENIQSCAANSLDTSNELFDAVLCGAFASEL